MRRDLLRSFLLGALCACAIPFAQAGGPLYIDEASKRPLAWPNNVPVKVYTDLGSLGTLSNEAADALVTEAFRQWTNVDTSAFSATIAGDLASIGLSDITGDNVRSLVGVDNGGGLHVVYDHDGSAMANYFGVDYTVLGIATPEWANGEVVTEAFVMLNGASVTMFGATPAQFSGVVTHEVGHSIGLAHSQTNGAAVMYRDATGPYGCTAPYADVAPAASTETMYPIISLWLTGAHMATVDIRDDRVSLSNLYPGAGWSSGARISGRLQLPDGTTELSGVNIVARNIANPFNDAVSALSGDQTRGLGGADGRFSINGLTPGAHYVLYADTIVRGGYSTTSAFLPYGRMSEEFWNTGESGDGAADPRCASSTLVVASNTATPANIVLNTPANEHLLRVLPQPRFEVTDVSDDGRVLVGFRYLPFEQFARAGLWTEAEGLQAVPGSWITGGTPKVTGAGDTVFTSFDDGNGVTYIGKWRVGEPAAERLGDGMAMPACGSHGPSVYDISGSGDIVVGNGWRGCKGFAFKWTPSTGFQSMGGIGPLTSAIAVSDDGSTVAGWNDSHAVFQHRQGTYWYRGRQTFASPAPASAKHIWREAEDVSADGKVIVGGRGGEGRMPWRLLRDTGERRLLPYMEMPGADPNRAFGLARTVSDDGTLVFGIWTDMWVTRSFMWTETLGMIDVAEFLYAQGADHARDIEMGTIAAITPDNHTLVGAGYANGGLGALVSFTSRLDTVAVCTPAQETQYVAFPRGLEQAVRDGARAGRCDRLAM